MARPVLETLESRECLSLRGVSSLALLSESGFGASQCRSNAERTVRCDFCKRFCNQKSTEVIDVTFGNLSQWFFRAEERQQVPFRVTVERHRALRNVGTFRQILRQEVPQRFRMITFRIGRVVRLLASLSQAGLGELSMSPVVELCQPCCDAVVELQTQPRCLNQFGNFVADAFGLAIAEFAETDALSVAIPVIPFDATTSVVELCD